MCKLGGRDHNATSYSTETDCAGVAWPLCLCRDHNATSYSTETRRPPGGLEWLSRRDHNATSYSTETSLMDAALGRCAAEIITLRAIALKQGARLTTTISLAGRRDHNATSYSTETVRRRRPRPWAWSGRDHNATSYSTETLVAILHHLFLMAEIITLRAIALKLTKNTLRCFTRKLAEIITLRAIALKRASLSSVSAPEWQRS